MYNGITEENNFNIAEDQSIEALTEALLNPDTKLTKLTLTVNSKSIDANVMLKFYEGIKESKLIEFDCKILPLFGNGQFIDQLDEFIINNNITIEISIDGNKGNLCSKLTKFNKLLQEQEMADYGKSFGLDICQDMMNNAKLNGDYEKLKVFVGHNIALFSQSYNELLSYDDPSHQDVLARMLDEMIAQQQHSSYDNVEPLLILGQHEHHNEIA